MKTPVNTPGPDAPQSTPEPAHAPAADPFADARALAQQRGGFFIDLPRHALIHIPPAEAPARRRLIVSFENLASFKLEGQRLPWGQNVFASQGWDVLGVMAKEGDFFRSDDLFDALEKLRDDGFFAGFPDVSMYGTSMGGYGACAFAGLAPGCTVMAYAPQSSLDPAIAPFDRRYPYARRLYPWRGRYLDAAEGLAQAALAYILYDPSVPEDRQHMQRLTAAGPHVVPLPCPFMSHKLPPAFLRMRMLKQVALAGLTGGLDPQGFARMIRARRENNAHVMRVCERAVARGHLKLALRALNRQAERQPNWKVNKLRRHIRSKLTGTGDHD